MEAESVRCDIFCAVIDNFGDAAVCWRLARLLAVEHGWRVRLWIDRPEVLSTLVPDAHLAAVTISHWDKLADNPADVVIEAFGCELPTAYIDAMAQQAAAPVWLNLEYLSAEAWVEGCHSLASPHPRLPLTKHFFFPGFMPQTGGLLREADYARRRAAFDAAAFRAEFGLPQRQQNEITLSLFSYPNPALPALQAAWAASPTPILALLPGASGPARHEGLLCLQPLPFLPQPRYDELLWACDLNFVRGEDSFVRAQWAAKPFVWHIYPQDEATHLIKLDAFLARHPNGTAMAPFWHAWNGAAATLDWPAFAALLPTLKQGAVEWENYLAGQTDLATNLVDFCRQRLKCRVC